MAKYERNYTAYIPSVNANVNNFRYWVSLNNMSTNNTAEIRCNVRLVGVGTVVE